MIVFNDFIKPYFSPKRLNSYSAISELMIGILDLRFFVKHCDISLESIVIRNWEIHKVEKYYIKFN